MDRRKMFFHDGKWFWINKSLLMPKHLGEFLSFSSDRLIWVEKVQLKPDQRFWLGSLCKSHTCTHTHWCTHVPMCTCLAARIKMGISTPFCFHVVWSFGPKLTRWCSLIILPAALGTMPCNSMKRAQANHPLPLLAFQMLRAERLRQAACAGCSQGPVFWSGLWTQIL